MTVVTYRPFGELMPRTVRVHDRQTLAELAALVPDLPDGWPRHDGDQIHINGHLVPREAWARTRVMPSPARAVEVTFHAPPMGGGDQGGKQVLALVASIALTAGVGWIAGGGLEATLGAKFAEGTIGAKLAAAGGALAGSLAMSALAPPPLSAATGVQRDASGTSGNVLEPNAAPPRVIGTRRVTPPLLAQPIVTRDGSDEIVEAVYGLAGPHRWSDIRVNGVAAGEVERLEIEQREGWPGDPQIELVTRIGAMDSQRGELRGYTTAKDGKTIEAPTGKMADAVPQPMTFTAAADADEVQLHLNFPSGLNIAGSLGKLLRVPFRMRLRNRGQKREDRLTYDVDDPALAGYTVPLLDRVKSATIVADVTFGQSATGTILDLGSAALGAYLGITDGDLVFRWGGAAGVARVSAPVARLQGQRGTVVAEVDLDGQDARLWWRDYGSAEMVLLASGPASGTVAQWCDAGIGRAGGITGSAPSGEDGGDWSGEIHDLRIAHGSLLPDEWVNLPEVHFQGATTDQMRPTIRIVWSDDATASASAEDDEGFAEARIYAPAEAGGDDWSADSYFVGSGLADYMDANTLATTRVRHVEMDRHAAVIMLDRSEFPAGIYEIEIRRGALLRYDGTTGTYDPATYASDGVVYENFGVPVSRTKLPHTQKDRMDTVYIDRVVSLKSEHPLPDGGFAVLALRGRNIQIDELSALASGYVRDWDGTGWNFWTTTSNPAPHLIDVYFGSQSGQPLPTALLTDEANAEMVAWRTDCQDRGLTCDMIAVDKSFPQVALAIAASGYARPYVADIAAVARDRDRTADDPVQIFTPRNSSGFRYTKSFEAVPDGFLVNFTDRDLDYRARQVLVPSNAAGLIEQVDYEGPTTEAQITARANFDLLQAVSRSTRYAIEAPAEAIVCRRGSLIGIQHDMLTDRAGQGRLVDVEYDAAGMVTHLHLDQSVPVLTAGGVDEVADFGAVDDVSALGARTGVVIRRTDGTRTVHEITGDGEATRLTLASPVSATGLEMGCLVAVGSLGAEMMRGIVTGITYAEGLTHTIHFVDEAPELFE